MMHVAAAGGDGRAACAMRSRCWMPFQLAGLSPLVTIGGSLVAALAVLERPSRPSEAWEAVSVDERWQLEQWGADAEAEAALDNRRRDFLAAAAVP